MHLTCDIMQAYSNVYKGFVNFKYIECKSVLMSQCVFVVNTIQIKIKKWDKDVWSLLEALLWEWLKKKHSKNAWPGPVIFCVVVATHWTAFLFFLCFDGHQTDALWAMINTMELITLLAIGVSTKLYSQLSSLY